MGWDEAGSGGRSLLALALLCCFSFLTFPENVLLAKKAGYVFRVQGLGLMQRACYVPVMHQTSFADQYAQIEWSVCHKTAEHSPGQTLDTAMYVHVMLWTVETAGNNRQGQHLLRLARSRSVTIAANDRLLHIDMS